MLLHYLLPVYLIFFGDGNIYSLPENECSACISRNVNEHVEFSTPPGEEIIFNKIIREDTVYRVQFMVNCEDFKVRDSAAYLELANGRQIGRVRVPIEVKMAKSMKKPFILVAAFDLSRQEIVLLRNFGIESFAIGKQKCRLENKKQEIFLKYFKCLTGAG
ncbi:MAG TPA: hypothetical protein VJY62_01040 [Bacteroidia bacterium]|nr:hypothetical protein [Bacteroidia bacterium]